MRIKDNLLVNRERSSAGIAVTFFFSKELFPHQEPFSFSLKVDNQNKLCNFQVTFYKLYEITSSWTQSPKEI